MTPEDIARLSRDLASMRKEIEEFAAEFSTLTELDLEQMIKQQCEIVEEASWRMSCAETELKLRLIKTVCNPT